MGFLPDRGWGDVIYCIRGVPCVFLMLGLICSNLALVRSSIMVLAPPERRGSCRHTHMYSTKTVTK
jgi:hypothetical protein